MTTRNNIQQLGRDITVVRTGITGTILPTLGLAAAFNVLSGSAGSVSSAGLAASSNMSRLAVTQARLTDAILPTLIELQEELIPLIEQGADKFIEWDKATDGLSTRLTLAGGAAFLLRNQIKSLIALAANPITLTVVGGGLAAGLIGGTAYDIARGQNPTDSINSTNARAAEAIRDWITGILGLPDVRRGYGGTDPINPSEVFNPTNAPAPDYFGNTTDANRLGDNNPVTPNPVNEARQVVERVIERQIRDINVTIEGVLEDSDSVIRNIRDAARQGLIDDIFGRD